MPSALATVALLIALAASLALAAGSGGGSPASGPGPSAQRAGLDPAELARIAVERTPRVARRVERLRGLRFDDVPEPQVSDGRELRRLAARELERSGATRELRADEIALRLLGLLGPEDEIEEIATDLTALAAAYYDPRRDELFVVSDAVPAGPEVVEFVLAHELTHALEDQRFGLPSDAGISDERYLAELALVEGTATALMVDYARLHLDPFALGLQAAGIDPGEASELPDFLEQQVEFTYLGGAELVDRLRRRAAPGQAREAGALSGPEAWALVDRAYRARPPQTTEQVLHPRKYVAGEPPLPVRIATAPGPGWRALDGDVIGEFFTAQILRVGVPGDAAEQAVAGWGGDRYRLWRRRTAGGACESDCRADHALVARWRWDTRSHAREFHAALTAYLAAGLGGDLSRGDIGRAGHGRARAVWTLAGGWAAVAARGDRVTLALAPTAALAGRLGGVERG